MQAVRPAMSDVTQKGGILRMAGYIYRDGAACSGERMKSDGFFRYS
jgi:hypothetical protein